jgi:hypothetical protein
MISIRRLLICLLGGTISAAVCLVGRQIIFGFPELTLQSVSYLVGNRILLGFAIGISAWKIHYLLHGALLGLLFSLSVSIGFMLSSLFGFFLYTIAGTFYGIFIEWLSTDLFRAPK